MRRFLLLFALPGLLASCRPDDEVLCAPTLPVSTASNAQLTEFARRNGAPVQLFDVVLSGGVTSSNPVQSIQTKAGATISFPAGGFLLPDGRVATGPAQVRVREIYSVPDMLLSRMPTQTATGHLLLVSGGEFSLQFWQNGARLRLASSGRLQVTSPQPAGTAGGQQLWVQTANRVATDSTGWQQVARPDSVVSTTSPGSVQPMYQTTIPLDSISWWNIDKLWASYFTATQAAVTVRVPAVPANSTSGSWVFLRPVGTNGLMQVYPSGTANEWSGRLPTGASLVAVVLQSVSGQLYYGTQPFTVQSSLTVAPTLTAVSEAQAVQLIRQL